MGREVESEKNRHSPCLSEHNMSSPWDPEPSLHRFGCSVAREGVMGR